MDLVLVKKDLKFFCMYQSILVFRFGRSYYFPWKDFMSPAFWGSASTTLRENFKAIFYPTSIISSYFLWATQIDEQGGSKNDDKKS
jgi:hypothetical protein